MSRWSWHGEEPARGVEAFSIDRDGRSLVRLEVSETVEQLPDALNAFCAVLAGQTVSAGAPGREAGDGVRAGSTQQDDVATPADTPSTLQQQRDIHIEMAKLGGRYREREFRLQAISSFLGRQITSTKQLTPSEADSVLARVEERLNERRGRSAA